MARFENTTVVVTGGGGGIGSALCRGFAAEGARVAVLDRDGAAASKVAGAIGPQAAASLAVVCDITERASVDAAVATVTEQLGPIDVLVNNAGWDLFVPFLDTAPEDWTRLIDINLVGALNMHHAILPGMVERGRGRVVNIASDAARVGSSGRGRLCGVQGGTCRILEDLGSRAVSQRHHVQRRVPGPDRHRPARDRHRRSPEPREVA